MDTCTTGKDKGAGLFRRQGGRGGGVRMHTPPPSAPRNSPSGPRTGQTFLTPDTTTSRLFSLVMLKRTASRGQVTHIVVRNPLHSTSPLKRGTNGTQHFKPQVSGRMVLGLVGQVLRSSISSHAPNRLGLAIFRIGVGDSILFVRGNNRSVTCRPFDD